MPVKTVDIDEAQVQLKELLSLIGAGTEIVLTQEDTPIARIISIESTSSPRVAGLHQGAMKTTDDFDEPLSDEFWTMYEYEKDICL